METTEQLPLRKWTVADFDRLCEAGLLSSRGYELLDGVIYSVDGVVRRFSIRDYDRMVEAGILTWEERSELVDGHVFRPPGFVIVRASVVTRVGMLLDGLWRDNGLVSRTGYVILDEENVVSPDVTVLRWRANFYADRWPEAPDVQMLVEIARPLSSYERRAKRDVYARFELPEYWVADPGSWTVVVHHSPEDGKYAGEREYRVGESWTSPALGGREVKAEDVLGPTPPWM
jgi:Putative restriction endonuclease